MGNVKELDPRDLQLIEKNIMKWYKKIDNSKSFTWYQDIHNKGLEWANHYDVEAFQVYGIISAFSPMMSWKLNQENAIKFLEGKPVNYLGRQVEKAHLIYGLTDEMKAMVEKGHAKSFVETWMNRKISVILSGRKTVSFFDNMCYPEHSNKLTIDVHMWNNFKPISWTTMTEKRYTGMENVFREVSSQKEISVPSLQSSLWVTVRGAYD